MYWEKAMRHKKPRFIICTYKDFTLSRNKEQRPLASFNRCVRLSNYNQR